MPNRAFQRIPVVDIEPLVQQQDQKAQLSAGRELHIACKNVGFFYIINHGIDEAVLRGVLRHARAWFGLPTEVKKTIELTAKSKFRGYQPLGANVTRYAGGYSRDWHEGIDLYREGRAGSEAETAVHGFNLWPDQLPEFEKLLRAYIASCLRLGQLLMQGIALGLGLPRTAFEEPQNGGTTSETSYWVTRVLHYPPLSQGDAHQPATAQMAAQGEETQRSVQLSCGEHTDYGLLTFVNQEDGISALQVKNQAGQWIDAAPVPGALVCNLGDMLKVYTNGLYTPTAHRVVNSDPNRARVSIPFFYETAFDSVVRPLPQLVGPGKPHSEFEPITYGDHLLGKVLNNFELEPSNGEIAA